MVNDETILAVAKGPPASLHEITIGDLLRSAAEECPDRVAFKVLDPEGGNARITWTYSELLRQCEAAAAILLKSFVPGEHLAIWSVNRREWTVLQLGAMLAGMVVVAVNPSCRINDLTHIVRQSEAVALFYDSIFPPEEEEHMLSLLRESAVGLRVLEPMSVWAELAVDVDGECEVKVSPGDPAIIQFTSGTTGSAKGAMLTHRSLVNAHLIFEQQLALGPAAVWLNSTPLHTIAGSGLVTLAALCNRGTHLLLLKFTPELVFRAVSEERANWTAIVPTMATMLLEHPGCKTCDFASLRAVTVGGSPVAPELAYRIEREFGADFCMIYGQTEAGSAATHGNRADPLEIRATTAGKPLPGRELRICDPASGATMSVGETGEICIRGLVMEGYFGLPDATAAALDEDGWLHTGDLGELANDGSLTISGRLKDMIIRGGLNVYPREIEDLLVEHPSIAEAAVFGAPDAKWGEIVIAAVRPIAGTTLDHKAITDFVAARIARYKVPTALIEVGTFPLTPSGKVQKFALRDIYLDDLGRG